MKKHHRINVRCHRSFNRNRDCNLPLFVMSDGTPVRPANVTILTLRAEVPAGAVDLRLDLVSYIPIQHRNVY
jgi:hypothetical protein